MPIVIVCARPLRSRPFALLRNFGELMSTVRGIYVCICVPFVFHLTKSELKMNNNNNKNEFTKPNTLFASFLLASKNKTTMIENEAMV